MIKNVLQNAINQLEAEKSTAYQNAKAEKLAELQQERNDFIQEKTRKVEEAINDLKNSLAKVIDEKDREIEAKANAYASLQAQNYTAKIEALQKLIEG